MDHLKSDVICSVIVGGCLFAWFFVQSCALSCLFICQGVLVLAAFVT